MSYSNPLCQAALSQSVQQLLTCRLLKAQETPAVFYSKHWSLVPTWLTSSTEAGKETCLLHKD